MSCWCTVSLCVDTCSVVDIIVCCVSDYNYTTGTLMFCANDIYAIYERLWLVPSSWEHCVHMYVHGSGIQSVIRDISALCVCVCMCVCVCACVCVRVCVCVCVHDSGIRSMIGIFLNMCWECIGTEHLASKKEKVILCVSVFMSLLLQIHLLRCQFLNNRVVLDSTCI